MEIIFEKYRIVKADDMNLVIEKKVIIGKGKNEVRDQYGNWHSSEEELYDEACNLADRKYDEMKDENVSDK